MLIRIGFEIELDSTAPVPMLLALSTHSDTPGRMTGSHLVHLEPTVQPPRDIDPFGTPALFYAAIAGIWLFVAGLISGYYDNKALYTRMGQRVRQLRFMCRLLGPARCARVSQYIEDNLGGLMGNLFLGILRGANGTVGFSRIHVGTVEEAEEEFDAEDIADRGKESLARLRYQRRVFDDWGMHRVATTGRGISALFQGPPGTGKTMLAGALARELGIEMYRVDLSKVMSKWIGETERNLGNVFSAAEQSQAVILFDEADSLFSKRTEVKSSNDRFANLEVNYLLQRLDSFLGIAILTTNLGTAIDSAFKRRLTFRIQFPVPDEEQREQLWRVHLPATVPLADDLDLEDLARKFPLTGGSVRNCALRAAFLPAADAVPAAQEHLLRAIRLEYRAAGKLSESGTLE